MRNRSKTRIKTSEASGARSLSLSVMPAGEVKSLAALLILVVQIVLVCQQASTTSTPKAATTTTTTTSSSVASSHSPDELKAGSPPFKLTPRDLASETRWQPQDKSQDELVGSGKQVSEQVGFESSGQIDGAHGTKSRRRTQTTASDLTDSSRSGAAVACSQPAPDCAIPEAGHEESPKSRPSRSVAPRDSGEPQVLAATSQRLVIPCRNSSSSSKPTSRAGDPEAGWRRGPIMAPSRNGKPLSSSRVALVVWHKDDQLNSPVFVADTRGGSGSIREAKQRAISDSLQGRARADSIELGGSPAATPSSSIVLIIEEARSEDAGLYTCTIEFDRAPTQLYQTSVVVLDPPKNMIIRDESPSSVLHDQLPMQLNPAGPYDEGSQLALVCEAQRGQPEAGLISWWQLESVNQIGPEMLNTAAAAPRSPQVEQSSAEAANYLTTLSINNDRDLYLGRDSFQQNQVPFNQLVLQLLASSNHTSLLLMSGASRAWSGRLRHWRRVDISRTSKPTGGVASQQQLDSSGGTISSRLEIQQLTRANLAQEFLCLASNSVLTSPPLNSSLVLDLNLRPTEVRLVTKSTEGANFRSGQKTIIECHAMGSRPSPVIRWFLGARQLDLDRSQQIGEQAENPPRISEFSRDLNNLTKVSYLTLTPEIEDNQLQLSCSAHNPKLQRDESSSETQIVASDSLKINVQFAPRLSLQLGAVIRPDAIRLGSDIFMDCLIEANPNDIQELVWLHDGQPLAANISAGIVITNNQSLVLRNIGVKQRGAYECRARNSLGQSTSNRLEMRPRHEPICDESRTRARYEVALNQPTRIECHVLAEPSEDLHFEWRFNRSDGSESPTSDQHGDHDDSLASGDSLESAVIKHQETNFTQSSVLFTATSRRHFGQLLCSAKSAQMGPQARPCSIQLVQSEVPEPVRGCFVEIHSANAFSIHCQSSSAPSKSGQQHQQPVGVNGATHYILELYQIEQPARAGSERPPSTLGPGLMRFRQPGEHQQGDYEDNEQSEQLELAELQAIQQQRQTRVRRLESELPSFSVVDLQPNATYNSVIYVQNQKGRSQATHHQVVLSQAPPDGARSAASSENGSQSGGRPELMGKRSSWPTAPSTSSQLLSFLRIDDLLSGRNQNQSSSLPPPLIAVALIVLLSTISLVMIVFFVNRLICSGHRSSPTTTTSSNSSSSNKKRRKSSTGCGSSTSPTQDDEDEEEDDDEQQSDERFAKRHRKLYATSRSANTATAMTDRLTSLRPSERCQGILVGSGSDTSRETNTDSTLVSSPASKMTNSKRTDSTLNSGELTSSNWNGASQLAPAASYKRCSHGDLSQLSANHLMSGQRQCSGSLEASQYRSSTLKTQRRDLNRLNMIARPASGLDDQAMLMNFEQQQVGPYGAGASLAIGRRGSVLNNQLGQTVVSCQSRGTPQMSSVHSSECSSNNVDNSLEQVSHSDCHNSPNLSQSGQFQHQQILHHYNYLLTPGQSNGDASDHFDIGQLTGLADSGVYVISDGSSEHHRLDYSGEITPTGDANPALAASWCSQRAPNRCQVPPRGDHERCHLIGGASRPLPQEHQQDATAFMLSNSFSIPVALMDGVQDNRASSISSNFRTRLLSSDNLTLASTGPDGARCWPYPDRDQQQQNLMPPADFANDYDYSSKTISVPCSSRLKSDEAHSMLPVAQKQQKPLTNHRVKFDTSNIN